MGIKHRADSGFCKFSALSKLGFGRTNKCFEMPYVSYPRLVGNLQNTLDTTILNLTREHT